MILLEQLISNAWCNSLLAWCLFAWLLTCLRAGFEFRSVAILYAVFSTTPFVSEPSQAPALLGHIMTMHVCGAELGSAHVEWVCNPLYCTAVLRILSVV
jgi:hypothetical protein